MAKQRPNRHHYLPEFYLGAWCQPNRPLIRYVKERDGIHTREFYPGGVGYRTGLYKLQSATIKDGQVLETHHFEKLDSAAALVFARMIRDSTVRLTGNDNETIAKFLLSLPARNPWRIAMGQQIARQGYASHLSDLEDAKALGLPENQTVLGSIEQSNPHFVSDMTLVQMIEVSNDQKKIDRVLRMRCQVLDVTGASYDLVVGDRAFLLHGSLMGDDKAVVALPISPTRLLLLWDRPFKQLSTSELVKSINRESTMRAVEHIFAADKRHISLAKKHLRQRIHRRSDLLDF